MQRLEAMSKTEGLSNEGHQEENNNDISEDEDAYEDVFMNLEDFNGATKVSNF